VEHVVSGCKGYSFTLYKSRHDEVARSVYYALCRQFGISVATDAAIPVVVENDNAKICWDYAHRTSRTLDHTKPDITLLDKENMALYLIEVSVPADHHVPGVELEKKTKYEPLAAALKTDSGGRVRRVRIVPLVIGALGTVPELVVPRLGRLGFSEREAAALITTAQKAALYGTLRVLKRHLCSDI